MSPSTPGTSEFVARDPGFRITPLPKLSKKGSRKGNTFRAARRAGRKAQVY